MPLIHIDVGYNFIILYTLIHLKWGWGEGDSNVTSHDYDGLYILDIFAFCTTKKRGYPSVFKSAGIAPKSAGIGSKFLSRRFFSRRFKPLGNECGYRVARPIPALFKNAGKGIHPIPALLKAPV